MDGEYREAVLRIKNEVLQSRYLAAKRVNAGLLNLYYAIGSYISANTRAGSWGSGAIEEISHQLQAELPGLRGFSPTNMKLMRQFFEEWCCLFAKNRHLVSDDLLGVSGRPVFSRLFDDAASNMSLAIRQSSTAELEGFQIEAFLSLGFTHHRTIIARCKKLDERWYYITRCAAEFWSVEALKKHIIADEFHRYGRLPNNFEITDMNGVDTSQAIRLFKDEYLLDYINIEDEDDPAFIDERVLSREITKNITRFVMTMGSDFAFIGENHRLLVDEEEFFIDLLMFNRSLDCLVAIELKRGKFKPAYLGQLGFYLTALDKYERLPDENKSVGLLLCRDTNRAIAELAIQDYRRPMGVATYRIAGEVPDRYRALVPLIEEAGLFLE